MPIVAGVRLSREHALELAAMLRDDGSDHTARLLLDGRARTISSSSRSRTKIGRESWRCWVIRRTGSVSCAACLFDELNWRRESLA